MKLYKIVVDEKALEGFIDFLPDLEDNEKFYCSLFARKKYAPEIIDSNDRTQLERFVATKENLIYKLRKLEIPLGRYQIKGKVIPQEALVAYINPNPRNLKKATMAMGKKCWDLMNNNHFDLHQEAMSLIQQSKSRSCYVDFDIDSKDVDLNILEEEKFTHYTIIESRGGYHVLIDPKKETGARKVWNMSLNWHQILRERFDIDRTGDQLVPIVGCYQGGFTPRFIEI